MRRLGIALITCGAMIVAFGALWQLGALPGSRVVLPTPVALAQPTRVPSTPRPTLPSLFVPTPVPDVATQLVASDAGERHQPFGTFAVRLSIPAIKLETDVQQAGIVEDADGAPIWETRPFVAVHYGELTGRLGAPGNAVIAGHVVTINEGNVFRFLYQLETGDKVHIWDQFDREHDYAVAGVRLVPPSDTSAMDPTPDETLTLITCGGTFDPRTREFSERLIVTAKPL